MDNPPVTTQPTAEQLLAAATATPAAMPPDNKPTAPHNSEALVLAEDPKVKAYIEELAADRAALRQREKTLREAHNAAQQQLAEMKAAQEAAETARLTEQGKFKELYESSQKRVLELEAHRQFTAVKEAMATELMKHGAVDLDIAELILHKHKDVIQFKDGVVFGAAEAVEQYKMAKPGFFQQPTAPATVTTTGVRVTTPPPDGGKMTFNALDESHKKEDIDAAWKSLVNQLSPSKG